MSNSNKKAFSKAPTALTALSLIVSLGMLAVLLMLDFFRTTIEIMRKRLAKEPQQQFLRVVDRHRGFLAPCPKGKANGGMRTYGCRDCESFICSMTCVSGGSSGVYCAYPAQANTYGDWDTNYRV